MKVNQFIHVNRFYPLSSIDSNIVSNCRSLKVNTVIADTEGRLGCKAPVVKESGTDPVKGKNKNLNVSENQKCQWPCNGL